MLSWVICLAMTLALVMGINVACADTYGYLDENGQSQHVETVCLMSRVEGK